MGVDGKWEMEVYAFGWDMFKWSLMKRTFYISRLSGSMYHALWALGFSDTWWAACAIGMVFLRNRCENGRVDRDRGGSDTQMLAGGLWLPRGVLWGERGEGRGKGLGDGESNSAQKERLLHLTLMLQLSKTLASDLVLGRKCCGK